MRSHSSSPSLGDIAAKAAISKAAVSMALRNHPRIAPSTRKRIQAIAARLGWRPNPLLSGAMSSLRAGQPAADRVVLAWVTAHPRRDAWRQVPFFLRCFEGARARALTVGYHLKHFWLGDANGSPERLSGILYARGIAGLVIAPLPKPGSLDLTWGRFCAVTIGYSLTKPRLHRAIENNYSSARQAVARLAAQGRQRIGLVLTEDQDQRVNGMWSAGYLLQSVEAGIRDPALIFRPSKLRERPFLAWVDAMRPDAIISIDPRIPHWLQRAGRTGPRAISYVDLNLPGLDHSAWPGIFQDAQGIGASAVDLLVSQLMRHDHGIPDKPTTVMIESRWVDTHSAARIQNQAAAVAAC
jgi:LacI family transcriptional regulator